MRKRRRRTIWTAALLILAALVGAAALARTLPAGGLLTAVRQRLGMAEQAAGVEHGWSLILVNQTYRIPADWTSELTTLSNGEQVDSRIYPDLQAMFDDARAADVYPYVRAGYRTEAEQQRLFDEKVAAYRAEGHTGAAARALAAQWVAKPGTSEHQLGIAVDINADDTMSTADQVYRWLAENAYRYGFIQRYPPEKSNVTGVQNEPWHYRYVGQEAATEMYRQGLCLEEYVETLRAS